MQCTRSAVFKPAVLGHSRLPVLRSKLATSCTTSTSTRCACQQQHAARSSSAGRPQTACRAQKQDEKEKDIVGGIDINQEGDIWEGELIGIVFKVTLLPWLLSAAQGSCLLWRCPDVMALQVGIVLVISGAIAAILLLARPVIDNTVRSFPYRSSTNSQAQQSENKSLIPGLEEGGGLFD